MNTQSTSVDETAEEAARPRSTARLDYTTFGLAGVLFVMVTSAISILVTLPEALDAVAAPAFGAPWIMPSSHETTAAEGCAN